MMSIPFSFYDMVYFWLKIFSRFVSQPCPFVIWKLLPIIILELVDELKQNSEIPPTSDRWSTGQVHCPRKRPTTCKSRSTQGPLASHTPAAPPLPKSRHSRVPSRTKTQNQTPPPRPGARAAWCLLRSRATKPLPTSPPPPPLFVFRLHSACPPLASASTASPPAAAAASFRPLSRRLDPRLRRCGS